MRFLERVKVRLLEQKDEEIRQIEDRINELNREYTSKFEDVESQRKELEEVLQGKTKIQKGIVSDKEYNDIETIYNFIVNIPRIKRIVAELKKMPIFNDFDDYPDTYSDEIVLSERVRIRSEFFEKLKVLNNKITEILNAETKELVNEQNEENTSIESNEKKQGLLSRLFGRKKDDLNNSNTPKINENNDILETYKNTIAEFERYYDRFLVFFESEDGTKLDKNYCTKLVANINYICSVMKNDFDMLEECNKQLAEMQPIDLWTEILTYYSKMEDLRVYVKKFNDRIHYFEQLYKEKPEYFDIDKLQNILAENSKTVVDLRSKKKDFDTKNAEFSKAKEEARRIKEQITTLNNKKTKLLEEKNKIETAKTLQELGFKDKDNVKSRLSIDSKDYIVIPIPSTVSNVNELFSVNQELKVEFAEITFYAEYFNDIAYGRINSLEHIENIVGAILIPISGLDESDIDNKRGKRIGLNSSVLKKTGVRLYLKQGKTFKNKNNSTIEKIYTENDIEHEIKNFLGEDYLTEDDKPEEYQELKNIPDISRKEKRLKREAIKRCLFENVDGEVSYQNIIKVNGKPYFLNKEDKEELNTKPSHEKINSDKLIDLVCKIEDYLDKNRKDGTPIDAIYGEMFIEYLRVNKKAKAEYIKEEYTTISYNDKRISIKPPLPAKDEDIIKRYTRPNEDVAYKVMKLANLVNIFAHITEDEILQILLFEIKRRLIEKAIDFAKDNPKIQIKRDFDESKMAKSVIMEIPGYNMIALHIIDGSRSLMRKLNELKEKDSKVLNTSATLYPGVNKDLLMTMKKMSIEQRKSFLIQLNPNTFYKLIMRMGYNDVKITSDEEKKNFINTIISDEKLDKLLKECNDIERE